jgi:serine O-acetyltransferase
MSNEYKRKIGTLVDSISESYKKECYIAPHDLGFLPNRTVIIDTTKALRQLIFPSYFGRTNFRREIQDYHIGELLVCIIESLTNQFTLALKHQASKSGDLGEVECRREAERICEEFMNKIPQIREFLATDVIAAFDGDPAAKSKDEIIFCYPGVFAISIHRLAHELYRLSVPLIPRIMSEYAHNITGIDIHPGATIGKYFFIDHGTGVVIGETAIIGEHVKIYQGVTLGALSTGADRNSEGCGDIPA